jgi:hypothetical protein
VSPEDDVEMAFVGLSSVPLDELEPVVEREVLKLPRIVLPVSVDVVVASLDPLEMIVRVWLVSVESESLDVDSVPVAV